jgi:signal transduction histidine kinase
MEWRAALRARSIAAGRCAALAGLALAGLALVLIAALVLVAAPIGGVAYATGDHHANTQIAFAGSILGVILLGPPLLLAALNAMRGLSNLNRFLAGDWAGHPTADPYLPRPAGLGLYRRLGLAMTDPATWRDLLWCLTGGTAGLALLLVAVVPTFAGMLSLLRILIGTPGLLAWDGPLAQYGATLAVTGFGLWVAPVMVRWYGFAAHVVLSPSGTAVLRQRVEHLAQTRTETLDTSAAEIRRIERDLHDGAQARLVAMGMALDAAGQLIDEKPDAARALLIEARDNSAKALRELRELVRGIHPPVLADRGLTEAIKALALDTPMRVIVTSELPAGRPPAPVESAAYFAVSELLANVSKHAQAAQTWIDLRYADNLLKMTVTDDGQGGANPAGGTGLAGLERRLAAFDGVLAVSSPPGGPTVVNLEIPCELR